MKLTIELDNLTETDYDRIWDMINHSSSCINESYVFNPVNHIKLDYSELKKTNSDGLSFLIGIAAGLYSNDERNKVYLNRN